MIINATDWQRPKFKGADTISAQVTSMLKQIETDGDRAIDKLALQFDQTEPKLLTMFDGKLLP